MTQDSADLSSLPQRMADLGAEARIADTAGENTRGLLDFTASLPGRTKNDLELAIRNRIATRPDRMDTGVVNVVNENVGRAGDITSALTRQQNAVAGPLYTAVHSMNVTPTPTLVRDLEAAKKLGAWGAAERIALGEGVPFTLSGSQQALGSGQVGMRDLDKIKQGIDVLIDGQTDALTGKMTTEGASLVALKKRIVAELDSATNGAYAEARNAFAGPAALKSAINQGSRFWNDDAPRLASTLADMTSSEQAAFRIGAAEQLRKMAGEQTGQNRLLDIWKNRNTREKMQALLGDDVKYSDVEKFLKNEGTLKRLEGLGANRNSKTATRQALGEDEGVGVVADIASMKAGNPFGPLQRLTRNMTTTPEPVRDAIGRILLERYSPESIKALQQAERAMQQASSYSSAGAGLLGGKADPLR
jgi:hypothetical protein